MKLHLNSILLSASVAACLPASANLVAHFPMDVRGGQIIESVSGNRFAVQGHFAPENVPGAVGQALRFDGYTSFIDARINNIFPAGTKNMTVSIWTAIESYPIVKIDENTSEKTAIVSCIDEAAKTGFGFFIGFDGKYSFKTFIGGWPVEVVVSEPMPTYEWLQWTFLNFPPFSVFLTIFHVLKCVFLIFRDFPMSICLHVYVYYWLGIYAKRNTNICLERKGRRKRDTEK